MISAVVTVYNEEQVVPELVRRLETTLVLWGDAYEILFVDDGSNDKTSCVIEKARDKNKHIKLLQFSRNFGQVAALRAGLSYAQGDIVVTMDGDLQDLPEEIPRLIEKLHEGFDIVYAQREQRKHSFFRNLSSLIVAYVLRWAMARGGVVPLDKQTLVLGVFRAMRREVIDACNDLSEQTGYFQGLVNWVGFSHAIVPVMHGARVAGRSHYTLRKLFRYGLEAIVFLFPFPLRIFMFIGIAIAAISLPLMIITTRLFFFALSFWAGIQIAALGVLGEYICRSLLETKRRPLYVIRKKLL